MFQYNLVQRAKTQKKHIVLPEGEDPRILQAAVDLVAAGIEITLLGNPQLIDKEAAKLGLDLSKLNVLNPIEAPQAQLYAETLYELRKHKGMNLDVAKDMMLDVSYLVP